jgi:hypothetical protein
MQLFTRAMFLVLVSGLAASCSDTDARLGMTEPTGIGMSTLKVAATPATSRAQPVDNPVCPAVAPFKVPLTVVVSTDGSSVFISSIRAEFTDTSGRQAPPLTVPMPPVTLQAPGPTPQFGTPTAALFERTFPIVFSIGCGTGTTGTVVIVVDGSDHRGRRFSARTTVTVQ